MFGTSKPVSRVLSFKTAIYLDARLPVRSSRLLNTAGPACCVPTALLRIEFTASRCSHVTGELLPRLSTLTVRKYGGISLLHFSWGRPRRVLPVILALRSPDFPHRRAFRPAHAAVQLTCSVIIEEKDNGVKCFFHLRIEFLRLLCYDKLIMKYGKEDD